MRVVTSLLVLLATTVPAVSADVPNSCPPFPLQRRGERADRLVTGHGQLGGPIYSPDGTRLAYTGRCDGNTDVNVVAARAG